MRTRQQGAALILLVAVIALGSCWYLVSRVDAMTGDLTVTRRTHNAAVLNQAKEALIGYIAMNAANTSEDNPGRLPCPEPSAWTGTAGAEGIAAPGIQAGITASTCSTVGRLPWRTLGIDQLRDADGEPLWLVVGPSWRLTNSSTTLQINSNRAGDLTVGGVAQSAVALIIAPGAVMSGQSRSAPSSSINAVNYLECFNAAGSPPQFSMPGCPTNDLVMPVAVADVLPAIEAAVADRFERQIAPALRSVYSGGAWPSTPVLPFPATFADPTTSTFKGSSSSTQGGLLPLTFSETTPGSGVLCSPATGGARCDPTFVAWTSASLSGGSINSSNCTTTATQVTCTFYRKCLLVCAAANVPFTLTATAANVGMALRQFNNSVSMTGINPLPRTSSGVLNVNGSATITFNAEAATSAGVGFAGVLGDLLCGVLGFLQVCKQESIAVPIGLLADHPILDSTNGTYGWFIRNKWHEVAYYVVAPGIAPNNAARTCTGSPGCLTVNYHASASEKRGLLIFAGRSLNSAAPPRPNASLPDWLEGENCDLSGGVCAPNKTFAVRSPTLLVNRSFNDRIAVIDSN